MTVKNTWQRHWDAMETCGHAEARTVLEDRRYCSACFPYAWQNFVHRGHADEPAPVKTRAPGRCSSCGKGRSGERDHLSPYCGACDPNGARYYGDLAGVR